MEQSLAQKLAHELKIDATQVVREYWELIFLKKLLETSYGNDLVFKGGTALRLAYGSPRFSEDLDFALLKDSLREQFDSISGRLTGPFREAEVTDIATKRWTYLCEIKVTENYLSHPFRVKLEVSRRPAAGYEHELRLLTSTATPLQVLGKVATLRQLYQDKLKCVEGRSVPKDIFDLWFICQKLKIPYSPPKTPVSSKALNRDLRKYLPTSYHKVIGELL